MRVVKQRLVHWRDIKIIWRRALAAHLSDARVWQWIIRGIIQRTRRRKMKREIRRAQFDRNRVYISMRLFRVHSASSISRIYHGKAIYMLRIAYFARSALFYAAAAPYRTLSPSFRTGFIRSAAAKQSRYTWKIWESKRRCTGRRVSCNRVWCDIYGDCVRCTDNFTLRK